MATKRDFTIYQGATFTKVIRWESLPVVYKAITGITKAAPPVITAVAHGLVTGWRAAITNAGGMRQINAVANRVKTSDYERVTVLTSDTLSLDDVDATGFTTYTSGGVLQYKTPSSLAGYTARMTVRQSVAATTTLHTLTTENGGITLDNAAKTATLLLSATDTAAATWTSAVYDLEMVSGSGVVTRLMYGKLKLEKEVTR